MLTFMPDALDIAPEVLQAVSAVPTLRGYATPPSGVDLGVAALSATSQGGALLYLLGGGTRTIVGSAEKLEEAGATAWTDVTRTASAYAAGANRWRFAQFGNTSLAINLATVLQQSASGAFADVANAPKAALIEAASGFVMLANTDDASLGISGGPNAAQEHRWWCSQIFNPTGTWAPSVSTQATTGLLVETPGAITALRRLQSEIVAYKAKSIYVARYVGSPVVWQFQCVSTDIGCASHEAVVAAGTVHYFIGDDDIYVFDGSRPTSIGKGVKEWFFARLNRTYISNIRAIHDRVNSRIYWFYPVASAALTSCLVYHYDTQRWGHFDLTITDVLESITSAITYDAFSDKFGTSIQYDQLPTDISYNSPYWNAATPVLSYISTADKLTGLSGTASGATMTTGWYGSEDTVTVCTRVRPRYRTKPTAATITPASLFDLGGTIRYGSTSSINGDRFDVLQAGRYHRFALTFTGSMEVEALNPTLKPQGLE